MADAELHPHHAGLGGEDVGQVRRNIARPAEDVHDVHGLRDLRELPVYRLPEDLEDVGIVDGHGHDLVAGLRHVVGNVEGRLSRLGLGLDAEHRDALGLRENGGELGVGIDQVVLPVGHALSVSMC